MRSLLLKMAFGSNSYPPLRLPLNSAIFCSFKYIAAKFSSSFSWIHLRRRWNRKGFYRTKSLVMGLLAGFLQYVILCHKQMAAPKHCFLTGCLEWLPELPQSTWQEQQIGIHKPIYLFEKGFFVYFQSASSIQTLVDKT